MKNDIREIATILDDVIAKGQLDSEEDKLIKSFDPFRVHTMTDESPYYNPYRQLGDGTYAPHPPSYWTSQARYTGDRAAYQRDGLREASEFYMMGGSPRDSSTGASFSRGMQGLNDLCKSVDKFFKALPPSSKAPNNPASPSPQAGGVPVGTVHTYKDGQDYRKMAPGQWELVTEGHAAKLEDPKGGPKAHGEIEQHARAMAKIDEKLGEHKKQEESDNRTRKIVDEKMGRTKDDGEEHFDSVFPKISKEDLSAAADSALSDQFEKNVDPEKSNQIEDARFMMQGKFVDKETVKEFIQEFEPDFQALKSMDTMLKDAGATHFASRMKDEESLFEKISKRKPDRSLNTMTDVIGARGLTDSVDAQQEMLKSIKDKVKIVEMEDMSTKSRKDGYRAIHVIMRTPSNKLAELQLKTYRQQIWSGFTHDHIYKGDPAIKNDPDVLKYTIAISDHLAKLDKGEDADQSEVPEVPEILKENDIEFPWDEIKEFGLREVAIKKSSSTKYYGVIRDESKNNLKVIQFGDFKAAKRFKEDLREKGHKGEIPLAYSKSMTEFLETFHEYRPDNWRAIATLQDKIGKKEPGQGKEVKLESGELKYLLSSGRYSLISAGRHSEAAHTEEIPELTDAEAADSKLTQSQINERYKNLEKDLKNAGYTYTKVNGQYGEHEDHFLVMTHDADRNEMLELGKKYNQNSIIYAENGKQEMHFTVGKNTGMVHLGEGVEDKPRASDFYTEVETSDGQKVKFALNFDFNKLHEAQKVIKSLIESLGLIKSDVYLSWRGGAERWRINIYESEE